MIPPLFLDVQPHHQVCSVQAALSKLMVESLVSRYVRCAGV